jgi:hypothetical protein
MSARTILNPPISLSSGDGSINVETVNATSFSGGIAKYVGFIAVVLDPLENIAFNVNIPNFIGSSDSAYIISRNSIGAAGLFPIDLSVAFVSSSNNSTTVSINMYNASTSIIIQDTINYSIIAMN